MINFSLYWPGKTSNLPVSGSQAVCDNVAVNIPKEKHDRTVEWI